MQAIPLVLLECWQPRFSLLRFSLNGMHREMVSMYACLSVCLDPCAHCVCLSVCLSLCLPVCRCTWVSEEVHVFVCVVWIYDFASECGCVDDCVRMYMCCFVGLLVAGSGAAKSVGWGDRSDPPRATPPPLGVGTTFLFLHLGGQLFLCCDKEEQ